MGDSIHKDLLPGPLVMTLSCRILVDDDYLPSGTDQKSKSKFLQSSLETERRDRQRDRQRDRETDRER